MFPIQVEVAKQNDHGSEEKMGRGLRNGREGEMRKRRTGQQATTRLKSAKMGD